MKQSTMNLEASHWNFVGDTTRVVFSRQAVESDYVLPLLLKLYTRPLILLFFIWAALNQCIQGFHRLSLDLRVYLPTLFLL